jgi:hypothetical protein
MPSPLGKRNNKATPKLNGKATVPSKVRFPKLKAERRRLAAAGGKIAHPDAAAIAKRAGARAWSKPDAAN